MWLQSKKQRPNRHASSSSEEDHSTSTKLGHGIKRKGQSSRPSSLVRERSPDEGHQGERSADRGQSVGAMARGGRTHPMQLITAASLLPSPRPLASWRRDLVTSPRPLARRGVD